MAEGGGGSARVETACGLFSIKTYCSCGRRRRACSGLENQGKPANVTAIPKKNRLRRQGFSSGGSKMRHVARRRCGCGSENAPQISLVPAKQRVSAVGRSDWEPCPVEKKLDPRFKERKSLNATFTSSSQTIIVERARSWHALQYHRHLQSCSRSRAAASFSLAAPTTSPPPAAARAGAIEEPSFNEHRCSHRAGNHHGVPACSCAAQIRLGFRSGRARGVDQHVRASA